MLNLQIQSDHALTTPLNGSETSLRPVGSNLWCPQTTTYNHPHTPETAIPQLVAGVGKYTRQIGSGQKLINSQAPDNQETDLLGLLDFFRTRVGEKTPSSASGYTKALACFSSFQATAGQSDGSLTPRYLRDWLVYMSWRPLAPKTILSYFTRLSALASDAVKARLLPGEITAEFRRLKPIVTGLNPSSWHHALTESAHNRLLAFTRTIERSEGDRLLYGDIILFSLLNNAMSPAEVARLKVEDLDRFGDESREIARRHIAPGRSYIFPLGQSRLTPRQLERQVSGHIVKLLAAQGIAQSADPAETLRAHWAYAALRSGITASVIAATLQTVPESLPVLTLGASPRDFYGAETDLDTTYFDPERIAEQVADTFIANPRNWYAMRLRPRVRYEQLLARIDAAIGDTPVRPELFYPCDEIARRIGSRIVHTMRPMLPGIVFFRSRVTDLLPLFREIGDIAWCYTLGGTYARIPRSSMATFQQAIGRFTPDYEVGPVGTLPLRPGDRIEVFGGPFVGYHGEITTVTQAGQPTADAAPAPATLYRIRLFGDANDIEWRLRDPRLIRQIEV